LLDGLISQFLLAPVRNRATIPGRRLASHRNDSANLFGRDAGGSAGARLIRQALGNRHLSQVRPTLSPIIHRVLRQLQLAGGFGDTAPLGGQQDDSRAFDKTLGIGSLADNSLEFLSFVIVKSGNGSSSNRHRTSSFSKISNNN
jgi:hypothetical protein